MAVAGNDAGRHRHSNRGTRYLRFCGFHPGSLRVKDLHASKRGFNSFAELELSDNDESLASRELWVTDGKRQAGIAGLVEYLNRGWKDNLAFGSDQLSVEAQGGGCFTPVRGDGRSRRGDRYPDDRTGWYGSVPARGGGSREAAGGAPPQQ